MPSHVIVNSLALTYKTAFGVSIASIPDVCKTPSPGGPVPLPYPNFANQGTLKGGTTTVFAKGKMIAIKGSQYSMSTGDEPGTVGGVKSNTFKQATDWITYSFDVKMDGKNCCRNTDKKFHNNKNTANLGGNTEPGSGGGKLECAEAGTFGDLKKKSGDNKLDRDHVPSKAALKRRAEEKLGRSLEPHEAKAIDLAAFAVCIPKLVHSGHSRTYGGRNNDSTIESDSKNLQKAAEDDLAAIQAAMDASDPACAEKYREATKDVPKKTNAEYDAWLADVVAKSNE